jgi:hypothetical protein
MNYDIISLEYLPIELISTLTFLYYFYYFIFNIAEYLFIIQIRLKFKVILFLSINLFMKLVFSYYIYIYIRNILFLLNGIFFLLE